MPVKFEKEDLEPQKSRVKFELEQPAQPPAPEPEKSDAEAAADYANSAYVGAEQGVTFGFADEGKAAARAALNKLLKGDKSGWKDLYEQKLMDERNKIADAQKNLKSYLAGNLLGSLPTMAIPGLGVAKGAHWATALGKAGVQGTIAGLGASEGSLADDPTQVGVDALKGGAYGLVGQGVAGTVGGIASRFTPTALKQTAAERAVKAVTGHNVKAYRKLTNTTADSAGDALAAEERIRRAGTEILDSGVMKAGDTVEDLAPKLTAKAKEVGSDIGAVGQQIDELMPEAVDAQKMSQQMLDFASSIPPSSKGKKIQNDILDNAQELERRGKMGFHEAQDWKNQFKYKATDADALVSNQDAVNRMRGIVGGEMDQTAKMMSELADPEAAKKLALYDQLKKKYGVFKPAADAATARSVQNQSLNFLGQTDVALGGVGFIGALANPGTERSDSMIRNAGLGLAAALGSKVLRSRGNSTVAVTAHHLAKKLDASPWLAQKFGTVLLDAASRGPASLMTTHRLLMAKDRDYAQEFQGE